MSPIPSLPLLPHSNLLLHTDLLHTHSNANQIISFLTILRMHCYETRKHGTPNFVCKDSANVCTVPVNETKSPILPGFTRIMIRSEDLLFL